MSRRKDPLVVLKWAQSLDGYIDDDGEKPLAISSQEDRIETAVLRDEFDLILVGGSTIRRDNPRLTLKDEIREARKRTDRKDLVRAVLTASGNIDAASQVFADDGCEVVVFTHNAQGLKLPHTVTVVELPEDDSIRTLVTWCAKNGYSNVLVEGGGNVHASFISSGLVSGMRVAVGPFFVGSRGTARAVASFDSNRDSDGSYPQWTTLSSYQAGQTSITWYATKDKHHEIENLLKASHKHA